MKKEKGKIIGSKCSISMIYHHFQYLKQPPFQYYAFTNDQTSTALRPSLSPDLHFYAAPSCHQFCPEIQLLTG